MILLLTLFSFILAAYGAPNLPARYHVIGEVYLPYGEIAEPYEAWVDMSAGKSRIDYYGGMAKVINRQHVGGFGTMFKIVPLPEVKEHCFHIPGMKGAEVIPQPLFPDLSNFTYVGPAPLPNTHEMGDLYYKNYSVGVKKNEYLFFMNPTTKAPVAFYFKGYDELMGSHYDQYYFTYTKMDTSFDDSVFDIYKDMNCTDFPGPGLAHPMHGNPVFELVGTPQHGEDVQTSQTEKEFTAFKHKHNKQYQDETEEFKRKNHFRNNLRYINSHNRKGKSYSLAVNHLADMSDEERGVMLGYRYTKEGRDKIPTYNPTVDPSAIPVFVDWRLQGAVTRVKDQGICGSCWSFGSAETLEGSYFIKHNDLIEFSQQALMDCSWKYGNNACDGGEDFRSYQWILDHGCLPTAESYGQYLMQDGSCHADKAQCGVSITNYTLVKPGDEMALQQAIYEKGPISVAIDASHKPFGFYANGVYYDEACGNKPDDLDHAVLAVGYGQFSSSENEQYWIIKNSWSTYWGNDGYILMSRKNNNCGVATAASFAEVK